MRPMNALEKVVRAQVDVCLQKQRGESVRQWDTRFHMMPPIGWLNDPCGLCDDHGVYRAWFQFAPFDAAGALKCWGEYHSEDLVHWHFDGVPLVPDTAWDCHGVYTGSTVVEDDRLAVIYTGNVKVDGQHDFIHTGREANVIRIDRYPDGTWSPKRLLLSWQDYPSFCTRHVRDPKVWRQGHEWFMVTGARRQDDQGMVLLWRSDDGEQWHFKSVITSEKAFGYMWECPDLFRLDGHWFLSFSPQGVTREQNRRQNIYLSGYIPMKGGEDPCTAELDGDFVDWDYGFDFYAPQTFETRDGRRILFGWAGMADADAEYTVPTTAEGWQHMLTVPREVTLHEGRLRQNPVKELDAMRLQQLPCKAGETAVVPDTVFDLEIGGMKGPFELRLNESCVLSFDGKLVSLRFEDELGSGRQCRRAEVSDVRNVRVLADTSILEIYVNDGEIVFTSRWFPKEAQRTVLLKGQGDCRLWQLQKESFIQL